jgi:hypothetical protein
MKHSRALACLAAIVVTAAATGFAVAKDMRFPEKGDVAFVLHIPDGWTAKADDSGNLILSVQDKGSGLSLSVYEDKTSAVMPRDDFAKALLAAAKAEPFSKHEPASIGGARAEAYYSKMKNDKKTTVLLKVMILQVAQTHVVSETIVTAPTMSAAQKQSLDAMLKGITLTGVK